MKRLALFLFVVFSSHIYSQTKIIDSLKREISIVNSPIQKFECYKALADAYKYRSIDTAIVYNDSLRSISLKLKDDDKIMLALYNASVLYNSKGNYERSIKNQLDYLKYIKAKQDTIKMAMSYYQLGASHLRLERKEKAMEYLNKGLSLAEDAKDFSLASKIMNAIGVMFKNLSQYDKALEYYNKAIDINEKLKDTAAIGIIYNGKGIVFLKQKQKDSALIYFKKSLRFAELSGNIQLEGFQYRNIGVLLKDDKKFGEAENYLKKSLALRTRIGDSLSIGGSYYDLGELNFSKKDYAKAEAHFKESLKIMKALKSKSGEVMVYNRLASLYSEKGNFKKSNENYIEYIRLNDSLNNVELGEKVNEIQAKFDVERKNKELAEQKLAIEQQELQLQKKQFQNKLMTGLALFLLLVSLLSWFLYQQRQKRKNQEILSLKRAQQVKTLELLMEGEEKERIRIAQELHDGVNVDLSSIKYKLTSLLEENNKVINEAVAMIDKSCEQVRAISHDLVPPSLKDFSLIGAIRDFCTTKHNLHTIDITFSAIGDAYPISKKAEVNIFRILQELVNNSIKHADASEIHVQLSYQARLLQLTVEDDGKGFDNNTVSSGIGLRNIQSRVDYLGANLDFRSDEKGTSYEIEINTETVI